MYVCVCSCAYKTTPTAITCLTEATVQAGVAIIGWYAAASSDLQCQLGIVSAPRCHPSVAGVADITTPTQFSDVQ